jgi:hypothetical protein
MQWGALYKGFPTFLYHFKCFALKITPTHTHTHTQNDRV